MVWGSAGGTPKRSFADMLKSKKDDITADPTPPASSSTERPVANAMPSASSSTGPAPSTPGKKGPILKDKKMLAAHAAREPIMSSIPKVLSADDPIPKKAPAPKKPDASVEARLGNDMEGLKKDLEARNTGANMSAESTPFMSVAETSVRDELSEVQAVGASSNANGAKSPKVAKVKGKAAAKSNAPPPNLTKSKSGGNVMSPKTPNHVLGSPTGILPEGSYEGGSILGADLFPNNFQGQPVLGAPPNGTTSAAVAKPLPLGARAPNTVKNIHNQHIHHILKDGAELQRIQKQQQDERNAKILEAAALKQQAEALPDGPEKQELLHAANRLWDAAPSPPNSVKVLRKQPAPGPGSPSFKNSAKSIAKSKNAAKAANPKSVAANPKNVAAQQVQKAKANAVVAAPNHLTRTTSAGSDGGVKGAQGFRIKGGDGKGGGKASGKGAGKPGYIITECQPDADMHKLHEFKDKHMKNLRSAKILAQLEPNLVKLVHDPNKQSLKINHALDGLCRFLCHWLG